MLECKNVFAGYDGVDVVQDISFLLPTGKNLAILGSNGAGKSTLLKCIAGLQPFNGEIRTGNIDVKNTKRKNIAKEIAILGQFSKAAFSYKVFDVVLMGRYPHLEKSFFKSPQKKDYEIATQALKTMQIENMADKPITALSGGELQRVFLARVLAQEPNLILLDEPTNHLDLKIQAEIMQYLKEWSKEKENALVGVMHDITLALRIAEYALLLKDGKQVAFGKIEEVITPPLLEKTYGMDVTEYMLKGFEIWHSIKNTQGK